MIGNYQIYLETWCKIYHNMSCNINHIINWLDIALPIFLTDTVPVFFIYFSHLRILAQILEFVSKIRLNPDLNVPIFNFHLWCCIINFLNLLFLHKDVLTYSGLSRKPRGRNPQLRLMPSNPLPPPEWWQHYCLKVLIHANINIINSHLSVRLWVATYIALGLQKGKELFIHQAQQKRENVDPAPFLYLETVVFKLPSCSSKTP